ncbi:hypothetical protein NliqN6_0758 [Naganishia liquefaciens]|uniref:Alpha-MPP n=1 Tax=Naganishia liquefaciens TaxID=104408 RepID=A0A8H3YE28_9TREE|nr:hypothetical protein NliqN6_0758 [Naganishia liquefaciens]
MSATVLRSGLANSVGKSLKPGNALSRLASTSSYSASPLTRVTTLPNKIRVATETTPGHFQALGVYIDAGSRFESKETSGVSHLMDRMAFKSTKDYTASTMSNVIDSLGSNILCSSSRETIMYQATVFPHDVPTALSLMSSTIQRPLLEEEELEAQKEAAAYEIREIWAKPEMILPELVHTVAYRDNTLGMPLLCPEERLPEITSETLRTYMRDWYKPERMVIAGVGMEHEHLVHLATEHFGNMTSSAAANAANAKLYQSSPSSHPSLSKSFATLQPGSVAGSDFATLSTARARYTGGQMMIEKPEEEFTHVYVGFEGLGIHDPDIYALATMQMLLGGPGKGMYSRLYTKVLNQYHAVDYCAGFHHCYADTGLFGIAVSVQPHFNTSIGNLLAWQLDSLTRPMRDGVTQQELSRAKNQLKSSLMMALESRSVEVEDLGRQTQIHGHKVPVEEMCEKIDRVTLADIHRTATRVLRPSEGDVPLNYGLGSGQPTIVAQGKLDGLHDIAEVLQSWGLGKGGVAPRATIR